MYTSMSFFIFVLNLEKGFFFFYSEIAKKPHIKRWTVLKSRHVHKKHMVQYEVRTYHHKIQINRITGSTADTFLEYIQRNLPEGVSMRVGRVRYVEQWENSSSFQVIALFPSFMVFVVVGTDGKAARSLAHPSII